MIASFLVLSLMTFNPRRVTFLPPAAGEFLYEGMVAIHGEAPDIPYANVIAPTK